MTQISSSKTLILAIFLPTVWIAFFGIFSLVLWLTNTEDIPSANPQTMRYIISFILVSGFLLYWFTTMKLKRVDVDKQFVYVSNYFKTYKYSTESIASISERPTFGKNILVTIHLHAKGAFGNRIYLLTNAPRLQLLRGWLATS